MNLSLIWAQAASGVIGRDGTIPWRLPEDQARFKELTMGHTVVMGRLTWESLPPKARPLRGRRNVVLTRDSGYQAEGAEVIGTLEQVLSGSDVWVIGGGQIYTLTLPLATRCEVTEIDVSVPRDDGDVIAPVLDDSWITDDDDWQISSAGLRYRFSTYRRI